MKTRVHSLQKNKYLFLYMKKMSCHLGNFYYNDNNIIFSITKLKAMNVNTKSIIISMRLTETNFQSNSFLSILGAIFSKAASVEDV